MFPYRTRFKRDIVAEFLPPARKTKRDRVILLCDGMPGLSSKQGLLRFLSSKGFWAIHPRYRGCWESGGWFLRKEPQVDLSDILDELPKGLREAAFGRRFRIEPEEVFVIGGSFGGAAAILSTLDPRVTRAAAVCPVVDWRAARKGERKETSKGYPAYLKEAFGNGYRFRPSDWAKLSRGRFYNPVARAGELDPAKLLMFHAKDDPFIPWRSVAAFAKRTGAPLRLFKRGGHLSTDRTVRRQWKRIEGFFKAREQ